MAAVLQPSHFVASYLPGSSNSSPQIIIPSFQATFVLPILLPTTTITELVPFVTYTPFVAFADIEPFVAYMPFVADTWLAVAIRCIESVGVIIRIGQQYFGLIGFNPEFATTFALG